MLNSSSSSIVVHSKKTTDLRGAVQQRPAGEDAEGPRLRPDEAESQPGRILREPKQVLLFLLGLWMRWNGADADLLRVVVLLGGGPIVGGAVVVVLDITVGGATVRFIIC